MNSLFYALWVCFIVVTPCFVTGITIGFSSIALPELNLDLDGASWFSCLFTIGAPLGCIMTGLIIDEYGRKPTIMLCSIPGIIGWLFISTGNRSYLLFLGRILTGLSVGASFFPAQVYLAEYADMDVTLTRLRSGFTNWAASAASLGLSLVMIFGGFFSYRVIALISFAMASCSFCCIYIFIPESPIWLYDKGRYGDAEWAQKRLNIMLSFENSLLQSSKKTNKSSLLSKLTRRDVYIPLFITTGCMSLIMLSGCAIFASYLVDLVDIGGSYSLQDSYNLTVISGVLHFTSSIAEVYLVLLIGVRKLAIGTSLGLATCMLTYGIASYFIDSIFGNFAHQICIIAVWVGFCCIAFGFMSIPHAMLGELFPTDAKGLAMVPTIVMYIVQTTVVKFHFYLVASYGGVVYFAYAAFAVFQALFVFHFLPETVGKTALQIKNRFCR